MNWNTLLMNFEKMYVYRCRKTSHFSITEHRGWCGYNFNKINKEWSKSELLSALKFYICNQESRIKPFLFSLDATHFWYLSSGKFLSVVDTTYNTFHLSALWKLWKFEIWELKFFFIYHQTKIFKSLKYFLESSQP